MIDRDQLREAIADVLQYEATGVMVPTNSPIFEAARLVADPDTLVITKVNGEWPEWFRMLADVDQLDTLLEGSPDG